MRHQSPVRSRARSEYFYARAVRVQLHTRVFLKFKSSCTVVCLLFIYAFNYNLSVLTFQVLKNITGAYILY